LTGHTSPRLRVALNFLNRALRGR